MMLETLYAVRRDPTEAKVCPFLAIACFNNGDCMEEQCALWNANLKHCGLVLVEVLTMQYDDFSDVEEENAD